MTEGQTPKLDPFRPLQPRTDAAFRQCSGVAYYRPLLDLADTLERELGAKDELLRETLKMLDSFDPQWYPVTKAIADRIRRSLEETQT